MDLMKEIERLTKEELAWNKESYNIEIPYQSYERIGFEGRRWSVEKRVREYGLDRYFNPDYRVLDIGSNYGFIAVEFAHFCQQVVGLEPNRSLIEISELVADELKVQEKTTFLDMMFEDYETKADFDVVLSLAAFFTQDGRERSSAEEYFGRCFQHLKSGGELFYESTSYQKTDQDPHYPASLSATDAIKSLFEQFEFWETPSGSEGFYRLFCRATK